MSVDLEHYDTAVVSAWLKKAAFGDSKEQAFTRITPRRGGSGSTYVVASPGNNLSTICCNHTDSDAKYRSVALGSSRN